MPPLINLGRYQRRIAGAISRAVGRPVSIDSVSLRLLPWPAFKIENLAVGEQPGFGAEPALRAPEVVAEPRLSSLWRGRFELARVELTDASVNLVRRSDGQWNVSSVLLQASRVPNAPTSQARPGPAPRFPYIEATSTRINLKRGVEKLPYSLVDADFSMSLASPQVWHIKLEGEPVRTDLELFANDTGVLRIEGDLHRASALGAMPVKLDAEWSGASLGQLSRIALGRDTGWRGDIDATARLEGEFDQLHVQTHFAMANLHRQEFTPERRFTVDATCRGLYSRSAPETDSFRCRWPLGAGGLLLTASAAASGGGSPEAVFRLDVNRVPADVLAAGVGLFRPGAPGPDRFSGELSGSYTYLAAERLLTGEAAMPQLSVADGALVFSGLRLRTPEPNGPAPAGSRATPGLILSADPIDLGVPGQPMTVSAQISGKSYSVEARGAGTLPELEAAAAALGFPEVPGLSAVPAPAKPPVAQLALTGSGAWLGGEPSTTGSAHLHEVRWQPSWLPFPVDLHAADGALSPGLLRWTASDATAGAETGPMQFAGSAQVPLACAGRAGCVAQFALSTPSLDAAALQAALTGGRPELLRTLLGRFNARRVRLPALNGTVHAGVFTIGRLPIRDVSAVISTGTAAVEFQDLDGRALGGALHLAGRLSLAGGAPEYRVRGSLTGASAKEAAALWGESWGPGTLGGTVELRLRGGTAEELLGSAQGTFGGSWLRGAPAPPFFRFTSWDGSGAVTGAGLRLEQSTFSGTAAGVTGTIGWDRSLGLQLVQAPEGSPLAITGTLAQPDVRELPATE